MLNIDDYLNKLINILHRHFQERLIYVGLQGSYLRGEASDHSDIDVMVVLDSLCRDDLETYRKTIRSLEYSDKSCGFICSKDDLANWNPLEICNLVHTTKDYYGCIRKLVPEFNRNDICNYIKFSVNNIYHIICHRYIHADHNKDIRALTGEFKSIFYILQNLYYLKSGIFIGTKSELLHLLSRKDYTVLQRAIDLSNGITFDFDETFDLLLKWCQDTLAEL